MAQITASEVSKLRKLTGAGMMDCKKALVETDGDIDQAIENLRKKGQKIAAKREDREANEGCVLAKVSEDNTFGAIITLNAETDFVAKNDDFVEDTQSILNAALDANLETLDDVLSLNLGDITVEKKVTDLMGKIGEKIELGYYAAIKAEYVVAYVHPGNRLATIVGFNKPVADYQIAKDVAMQVAAMNPVSIDKDDCPSDVIEKEIEIGKDQARQEGKPEELLEKIALGKLNKFYKENTLLNQEFVKDNKQTIAQYLKSADKDLTVVDFKRYGL
ncbi:MAG: translation elongation factor Ts [Bacteroidales bacterium]